MSTLADTVGAAVPASGRYAAQGAQMRSGLALWAERAGASLTLEDDESRPERAIELYGRLRERCRLVLGPYGSDSTRAVAEAAFPEPLWNHGAAADDVQRLPGVVSLPSPASFYLVALGGAVGSLCPGGSVALVTGRGKFARFARDGFERALPALGLTLLGRFALTQPAAVVVAVRPDAVLLCGPVEQEVALVRALRSQDEDVLVGGLSPGLAAFPRLLGGDPEGLLGVSQWHPSLGVAPTLGPSSSEVVAAARASGREPLDYVAAQAYACALVATRCLALSPGAPLAAARSLRAATFFGDFALDPKTGLQVGHRLCVICWRCGRQELLLADAA